uniref:Uncharacterized protein n=1 Tax=Chrysotila carterae TaxID=13221 RepID=A0A6S9U3B8_CHRCT
MQKHLVQRADELLNVGPIADVAQALAEVFFYRLAGHLCHSLNLSKQKLVCAVQEEIALQLEPLKVQRRVGAENAQPPRSLYSGNARIDGIARRFHYYRFQLSFYPHIMRSRCILST